MEDIDELFSGEDDLTNNPKPPINSEEFNSMMSPDMGNSVVWEGTKRVGGTGFGESQFDEGATLDQIQEGRLNTQRAALQPWHNQLGNMIGQAAIGEVVGGTISGFGYMLDLKDMYDFVTGKEVEWGNFMTEAGDALREGAESSMRIYEKTPGEMNLSDPGYWFKNGVSVASSLSMMIPSMAATRALNIIGKGASRGMGAVKKSADIGSNMSLKQSWMADGISQAVVSRHIENSMEAGATFKEQMEKYREEINPDTGKKYTEEEAKTLASESAAYNYRHGWAMILQDIPQYLALGRVFNPITMKMERGLSEVTKKGVVPKWMKDGAITFGSEGAEEGYQHYIAEKAKLLSDLKAGLIDQEEFDRSLSEVMKSDQAYTSMLFGGLGGNLFQLAGKGINQVFKSKTRKEMEDKAADNYKADLANRSKQIFAMQTKLAEADQTTDEKYREGALNSMLTQTIIEAINNNKLDETIEALTNGPKMTQEEMDEFANVHGIEYNPELAKKYTPKILENAEEIRKTHLRNLNKADNKGVHKNIIGAMTMNEFQSKESLRMINELNKEYQEILESSPFTARNPSDYLDKKSRLDVNRKALKDVIKYQKNQSKKTNNPRLKKQFESIINEHEKDLKELENDAVELEKTKVNRSPIDRGNDRKAAAAHENIEPELVRNRAESMLLEDSITKNQDDLRYLRSKPSQEKIAMEGVYDSINKLENETQLEEARTDFLKNEGYEDGDDKKNIIKAFNKKLTEIKNAQKREAARLAKAKYKADKEAEILAKKNNPKLPSNTVIVPVTESLEDENAGEYKDFEEIQEESDAETDLVVENGSKTISLLDEVSNNKVFNEWKQNGNKKVGQKVRYDVSPTPLKSPNILSAKKAFNEAMNGTNKSVPQHVYENLPLIAYIGDGKSIFTFLPSKPKTNDGGKWERAYFMERKNIIDRLINKEKAETEIVATSGGQLITQVDPINGNPLENSILDLQQIKSINDVDLTYTNLDGKMIDIGTGVQNKDFAGKILSVGNDEKGNKMPYRGGLFLILNKADGTKFPVRLNFKKNTQEQAEVLADILIEIAVPPAKGEPKRIKMGQPLSTIEKGLQDRIKEVFGPELNVLGADPTMNEIINMFVYVSIQTKGLTSNLHMAGQNLNYGDNLAITPYNRNSKDEKDKLIDFLTNVKRRQLDVTKWGDSKYREFVLKEGIINTNVVTNEPAFQTTTNKYTAKNGKEYSYRIQTYVRPLANITPDPVQKVTPTASDKVLPKELQERMNLTKSTGMVMDMQGNPVAIFYSSKRFQGKFKQIQMPSMAAALAKYNDEMKSLPTAKKVEVIPNVVAPKAIKKNDIETTNQIADIERRRQEELEFNFGKSIELVSSGRTPVIERQIIYSKKYPNGTQLANYDAAKKLVDDYKEINAKYDAELSALERTTTFSTQETEIERRRQEELEIHKLSTPKTISQINAKYDAEIDALKNTKPVSDKKADIERGREEGLPIINVYWGSAETTTNTRILSNLAPRKFTWEGREYGSVEHTYQSNKSGTFDKATYDAYNNLKEISNKQGKGWGRKIRGKAVNKDFDNLQLMKDLVVESFKQNPEQAKLLLKYKDFTHTTNEVIDKAFLEGLKLAKYDAELAALESKTIKTIEERAEEIWRSDVNEKGFPNRALEEVVNELKQQESQKSDAANEEISLPSPLPIREKRKLKPAVRFKSNPVVKSNPEKSNPSLDPFSEDQPQKINKNCK